MKKQNARSATARATVRSAPEITSTDIYVRASDFAAHIAGVQFPPQVWAVFAHCETPGTAAELARRTRLSETDVIASLRRLAGRQLVCKNELDWQSYLASQRTPSLATGVAEPVKAVPPAVAAATPQSPVLAVCPVLSSPAPVAPAPRMVSILPSTESAASEIKATPSGKATAHAVQGLVVEFTLANASAAAARSKATRDQFSFTVGKSPERQPSFATA